MNISQMQIMLAPTMVRTTPIMNTGHSIVTMGCTKAPHLQFG